LEIKDKQTGYAVKKFIKEDVIAEAITNFKIAY
jgi:hypothetical protein